MSSKITTTAVYAISKNKGQMTLKNAVAPLTWSKAFHIFKKDTSFSLPTREGTGYCGTAAKGIAGIVGFVIKLGEQQV